jgi:hypothetical protein
MIWLLIYLIGAYVTALLDPCGDDSYRKRRMVWWPVTLGVVLAVLAKEAWEDK